MRLWSPAYLHEFERQRELEVDSLPYWRSYIKDNTFGDHYPEEQLPSCIIAVPETADQPRKKARGGYDAPWLVGVCAIVSGRDAQETFWLVRTYTAIIRAI